MLSHVQFFCDPMGCGYQAVLTMEFPRQEYWSELPFPSPGELPDSGIEPTYPAPPAFQANSLPLSHHGNS